MKLKAKLTADEWGKLDEVHKPLYVQDGESYKLDVDGFENLDGLDRALKSERNKVKELEQRMAALKDVDPDKYKELLAEKEQREQEIATKKGEFDKVLAQVNEKHAAELERITKSHNAQLSSMQAALERFLITGAAAEAIAKESGSPVLLRPYIERHTKVVKGDDGEYTVQVIDDSGSPKVNAQGKPMSIAEFVAELKKNDDFAPAFKVNGKGGGGAPSDRKQTQAGTPPDFESLSPTEKIALGLRQQGFYKGPME